MTTTTKQRVKDAAAFALIHVTAITLVLQYIAKAVLVA